MNGFGFRYVRSGTVFCAEYRLAHWSGYRTVRDGKGEPLAFHNPMDAALKAATELVNALNGTEAFWRGSSSDDARAAAEKFFTRATDGGDTQADAVIGAGV